MTATTIRPKTAHIDMGPTGFISYAGDFLNCYKSYCPEQPFSPAKYYLVCRSIELSLKSFLALKKVGFTELKRHYGHSLSKLIEETTARGLNETVEISEDEESEVKKANEWYYRKGFEYFALENIVESRDTLPDLGILEPLAQRLIDGLQPLCLSSAQQP